MPGGAWPGTPAARGRPATPTRLVQNVQQQRARQRGRGTHAECVNGPRRSPAPPPCPRTLAAAYSSAGRMSMMGVPLSLANMASCGVTSLSCGHPRGHMPHAHRQAPQRASHSKRAMHSQHAHATRASIRSPAHKASSLRLPQVLRPRALRPPASMPQGPLPPPAIHTTLPRRSPCPCPPPKKACCVTCACHSCGLRTHYRVPRPGTRPTRPSRGPLLPTLAARRVDAICAHPFVDVGR